MRKGLKIFLALLLAFMLITCLFGGVSADFGDFSGDSDYGSSSSSDYDSDSDLSGIFSGVFSLLIMGGTPTQIITFIVIAFIIGRIFFNLRKKSGGRANIPAGAAPTTGLSPLQTIYTWDPNFSADEMKQRLSKLYVQMQNGWTAKDLTPLRGDFTDEQFAQYQRQLERFKTEHQTNMVERIAVLDVVLVGVRQDQTHDILVANLSTRITDYTIDDRTGTLVKGSKTAEKFMQYEWTLIRPKGSQTVAQNTETTLNCPNCGAPVNVNKSAQCPYCDSVLSKADYDWVIAGIKGLAQHTS